MKKAVIFDLDGVLTFTDRFHYLAWKELADAEGIRFNEKINNRLRGVSRRDSLEIILEKAKKEYSEEEKIAMMEKKNNRYIEFLEQLHPEDIKKEDRETLEKLKEKGILLAVGSSSKNTMKILNNTDLTHYFDAIVDGNIVTKSKPDPEVFLLAAQKLNLEPQDCYVVEDAKAGIEAGKAGGFETCGIGKEVFNYDSTNHPIRKLSDLLSLFHEGPVLKLEHIKKVYPNGVCAVKDFSLDITDGEFVVFVGPSGCGKSTVLRMIAGLEDITEGEFLIDGEQMNEAEPKERNIAMVFQNYALYPHLTVRKNIGFPLYMESVPLKHFFNFKYRKNRKKAIDKNVDEVATKIGLSEYLDRKPRNLSGGQRQRVALGRAIIRHPKAFLLDEPLSNLDAKMRAEMRTEISKLHQELKTIFIYVTHDQVEAMTMGSKIVVMKDGYIQQIGTPDEVFLHPVNKFVAGFIGTPQMNFFNVKMVKEDELYFVLENGVKLSVPAQLAKKIDLSYLDKDVILGVRPKAISVVRSSKIKAITSISEQLGDEALVYFKLEGMDQEYILSMQTYRKYQIDEAISISFDLSHASLFDKEEERSILYEER